MRLTRNHHRCLGFVSHAKGDLAVVVVVVAVAAAAVVAAVVAVAAVAAAGGGGGQHQDFLLVQEHQEEHRKVKLRMDDDDDDDAFGGDGNLVKFLPSQKRRRSLKVPSTTLPLTLSPLLEDLLLLLRYGTCLSVVVLLD